MSFFAELKRRNVYKVVIAYAVGWLLVQIATQAFPILWSSKLGCTAGDRVSCDWVSDRADRPWIGT